MSMSPELLPARFSYFFFLSVLNDAVKDLTLRRSFDADLTVFELRKDANEISKNPDCLLVFIEHIEVLSSSPTGDDVEATYSPAGSVGLTLSGLTGSTIISPVVVFETDSFLFFLNIVGLFLNLNESLIFNLLIDFQLLSSHLSGDKVISIVFTSKLESVEFRLLFLPDEMVVLLFCNSFMSVELGNKKSGSSFESRSHKLFVTEE